MKVNQWFVVTALTIAAGTALASQPDGNAPLTRAEVRQSVLAARAAGELLPAGDAEDYLQDQVSTAPSTLTRSEVRHEVIEARDAGDLIPAGVREDEASDRAEPSAPSSLTRADVKMATLHARDAGELLPAGVAEGRGLAREEAQDKYAHAAWLERG